MDGVAEVVVPILVCLIVLPPTTSITCIAALVVPGVPKPDIVIVPVPGELPSLAHNIPTFSLPLLCCIAPIDETPESVVDENANVPAVVPLTQVIISQESAVGEIEADVQVLVGEYSAESSRVGTWMDDAAGVTSNVYSDSAHDSKLLHSGSRVGSESNTAA